MCPLHMESSGHKTPSWWSERHCLLSDLNEEGFMEGSHLWERHCEKEELTLAWETVFQKDKLDLHLQTFSHHSCSRVIEIPVLFKKGRGKASMESLYEGARMKMDNLVDEANHSASLFLPPSPSRMFSNNLSFWLTTVSIWAFSGKMERTD